MLCFAWQLSRPILLHSNKKYKRKILRVSVYFIVTIFVLKCTSYRNFDQIVTFNRITSDFSLSCLLVTMATSLKLAR